MDWLPLIADLGILMELTDFFKLGLIHPPQRLLGIPPESCLELVHMDTLPCPQPSPVFPACSLGV